MKIEYKGVPNKIGEINELVNYIENTKNNVWKYMGMFVEIDPTVDFTNQNLLVRWVDINEGFNDKIIVNSLKDFNAKFECIKND